MTTLSEINHKADTLLRKALNPVEYLSYQQQFSVGHGDFTLERQTRPEQDSITVAKRVAEMKKAGLLRPPALAKVVTTGNTPRKLAAHRFPTITRHHRSW